MKALLHVLFGHRFPRARRAVLFVASVLSLCSLALGLRSPASLSRVTASGGSTAPEVHLLLDFEGSSTGVWTTNRFFDGAHTNGNFSYWGINPDPQVRNLVTNDLGIPLISAVRCGGVDYSGTSSQSGYCILNTTAAFHDGRIHFSSGNRQGQMNVSFFFQMLPATFGLGDSIDLVQIEANGQYAVVNLDHVANPPNLRLHSNTNFGTVVTLTSVKSNFWYFCSLSYDTNSGPTGYSVLELRNGTNGAFIARGGLGHGSKQMAEYIRFGREDHSYSTTYYVRLDNAMVRTNFGTACTNYIWQ